MRCSAVLALTLIACGGETAIEEEPPAPEVPLGPCEVEWRIDEQCTGFPTMCTQLSVDRWGNVTRSAADRFCDGEIDTCTSAEFDEYGNVTNRYDGCGETPTACRTQLYDEQGRVREFGLDLYVGNPLFGVPGCDGIYEECRRTTYDGADVIRIETDIECDGQPEHCTEFDYENGVQVRKTESDCDGRVFECDVATADPFGRVTARHVDAGCDGSPDRQCFVFEYDGDSERPSFQRSEPICGGTAECEAYGYDGGVRLASISDCESAPQTCVKTETNDDGYVIAVDIDWGCDDRPELCSRFQYDARGNLVGKQEDGGCDEQPHRCQTRVYDGECRYSAAVTP
ncbi:MAG: hypothetical protein ACJAYU_002179 [Bradymonadia bacterium]|jgi:hypothetical protein